MTVILNYNSNNKNFFSSLNIFGILYNWIFNPHIRRKKLNKTAPGVINEVFMSQGALMMMSVQSCRFGFEVRESANRICGG